MCALTVCRMPSTCTRIMKRHIHFKVNSHICPDSDEPWFKFLNIQMIIMDHILPFFFCVYFIFFIVIPLLVHIKDGEKVDHEGLPPKFENWGPRGAGGCCMLKAGHAESLFLSFQRVPRHKLWWMIMFNSFKHFDTFNIYNYWKGIFQTFYALN